MTDRNQTSNPTRSALLPPALVYLAMVVLHTADHVRQGRELPLALSFVGAGALVGAVVAVVVAHRAPTWAGAVLLFIGIFSTVDLAAVHLVPKWGLLSDPYADAGVDALSWIQLFAYMAAGLWMALAGLRRMGRPVAA